MRHLGVGVLGVSRPDAGLYLNGAPVTGPCPCSAQDLHPRTVPPSLTRLPREPGTRWGLWIWLAGAGQAQPTAEV